MEHKFDVPPVSVSCHPTEQLLGIGHLDGSVVLHQYSVNAEKSSLTEKWTKRHKRAVRRVKFSLDGSGLFSITKNRALCLWDVETGKKIRCLRTAHDEPPYSLAVLPATSTKGQQVATADEGGVIRTWDFRASLPQICEFHDQEEVINEMVVSEVQGAWLLSASADGTLAAYNLRARKLFVRSEPMHSDLLSVCTTPNGRTYVGGGDGYIEVFNHGEWGNLVERIETGHGDTVDCLVAIRPNLLASASTLDGSVRLIHINPNKKLGKIAGHEDGVEQLTTSPDGSLLMSVGLDDSLQLLDLDALTARIPVQRASVKSPAVRLSSQRADGGFFADLNGGDGDKSSNSGDDEDDNDDDAMDSDGDDDNDDGDQLMGDDSDDDD